MLSEEILSCELGKDSVDLPLSLLWVQGCFDLLYSLEDKLVFSVVKDRMIHAVWYIIKVCELKMGKPEC